MKKRVVKAPINREAWARAVEEVQRMRAAGVTPLPSTMEVWQGIRDEMLRQAQRPMAERAAEERAKFDARRASFERIWELMGIPREVR